MPSKPVFLGVRLASLPMRSQERSVSSEDGMDCVLQEFDDDTGRDTVLSPAVPSCPQLSVCFACEISVVFCPTGLIQVWILLLEQLTTAVSNCPRQHQPPTLELLFTLLREVTAVPGATATVMVYGCIYCLKTERPNVCLEENTKWLTLHCYHFWK